MHPDKNSAPGAEEGMSEFHRQKRNNHVLLAFKKVGEAYSVLSDTTKRQIYDVHGKDASRTAGSGGPPGASPFGRAGPGAGGFAFE